MNVQVVNDQLINAAEAARWQCVIDILKKVCVEPEYSEGTRKTAVASSNCQ